MPLFNLQVRDIMDHLITYDRETFELYGFYVWVPNYDACAKYATSTFINLNSLIMKVERNIEERKLNRD